MSGFPLRASLTTGFSLTTFLASRFPPSMFLTSEFQIRNPITSGFPVTMCLRSRFQFNNFTFLKKKSVKISITNMGNRIWVYIFILLKSIIKIFYIPKLPLICKNISYKIRTKLEHFENKNHKKIRKLSVLKFCWFL